MADLGRNDAPLPVLQGMRIIEASAFVAAPLGGMTLAQMGADVIRIDPPGGGLDFRRWPVTETNASLFWSGLNKSKRSVTIDLSKPKGQELAAALITAPGDDAGMFLTNMPMRGALAYDALRARRDDLIQLTIVGDRKGGSAVDYTINPRVGIPYLTGPESDLDVVVNHVLPAWDIAAGHMAAAGLLAAERYRRLKGQGQHVRLALEDVALAVLGHLGWIAQIQLGQQRDRVGNDLYGAFGRDFVCSDGERIMVVGLTKKQWRALCRAMGIEQSIRELGLELGVDLDAEGARFKARERIAVLVAPWIAERSLSAVADVFDAHGVCWGRYQTLKQLVTEDESCSLANPLFGEIEQADAGTCLAPGPSLFFSAFERMPVSRAPMLGEHTEEVLSDLLGIDGAAYGRLIDEGVVGRPLSVGSKN